MTRLAFDAPAALALGLPLVAVLLVLQAVHMRRRGLSRARVAGLPLLRALALVPIVVLLARPIAAPPDDPARRRSVAVLLDRSRSMDLREGASTRFTRARTLLRDLRPALLAAGLETRAFGFAEHTSPLTPDEAGRAAADGRATDLGTAVSHALSTLDPPPLAVVALTDGVATRTGSNPGAVQALLDTGVPFLGVGFGQTAGLLAQSLELAGKELTRACRRRVLGVRASLPFAVIEPAHEIEEKLAHAIGMKGRVQDPACFLPALADLGQERGRAERRRAGIDLRLEGLHLHHIEIPRRAQMVRQPGKLAPQAVMLPREILSLLIHR